MKNTSDFFSGIFIIKRYLLFNMTLIKCASKKNIQNIIFCHVSIKFKIYNELVVQFNCTYSLQLKDWTVFFFFHILFEDSIRKICKMRKWNTGFSAPSNWIFSGKNVLTTFLKCSIILYIHTKFQYSEF